MNVVGLGKIFEFHYACLKENVEFNVGIDLYTERFKKFKFNNFFQNIEMIPKDGENLLICTPPNFREQIFDYIKNYNSIFIEKPLTFEKNSISFFKKNNLANNIYVLQTRRFFNNYSILKDFLKNKHIKKIIWEEGSPFGWQSVQKFHNNIYGSIWFDLGIHVIDSLRYILGDFTIVNKESLFKMNEFQSNFVASRFNDEINIEINLSRKKLNNNWIKIILDDNSYVFCKTSSENFVYIKNNESSYRLTSNESVSSKQPVMDAFKLMWDDALGFKNKISSLQDNIKSIELLINLS